MDGVQALSRFDDGFTSTYFNKAEALLDLAIECALERRPRRMIIATVRCCQGAISSFFFLSYPCGSIHRCSNFLDAFGDGLRKLHDLLA
jgi:hypothetical protein